MSLNKVQLIGNLGRDAELKFTPGGTAVASFSLATTEKWTDKGGAKQERTEWHRCNVWDKQASNLAEYLTKGKQIYVEGRLQTRKWTDKNQIERYTTEIRVDKIVLLNSGSKGGVPHPADTAHDAPTDGVPNPVDDSDIPF